MLTEWLGINRGGAKMRRKDLKERGRSQQGNANIRSRPTCSMQS